MLVSDPSSPVRSVWVPGCFRLATLGGAAPLCRTLTGGGCGCVYCLIVHAPPSSEETKKGTKRPSKTLICGLGPRPLIVVCAFWRDLMPDQCWREAPPRGAGSGKNVVEEELGDQQHTEDETVAAR